MLLILLCHNYNREPDLRLPLGLNRRLLTADQFCTHSMADDILQPVSARAIRQSGGV